MYGSVNLIDEGNSPFIDVQAIQNFKRIQY